MDSLFSLKDNIFLELLFLDNPQVREIAKYTIKTSKLFVGVLFMAGSLWEFFRENQYQELILRTVFCLIIFSTYESFLAKSIKQSFQISQTVLDMGSKKNHLIESFRKAGLMAKKETNKKRPGLWKRLSKMAKTLWSDPISTIIWILTYIAFMLLSIIYTILFSLFYVFLPIQALLFIFPPLKASLKGALKTYMTLIAAPLVMAIILIVLGNNADSLSNFSQYTFSENLQGLIQLFLLGILLLFSIPFASSLFDGRGVAMASNKLIQVSTMALMTMGLRSIITGPLKLPKNIIKGGFKKTGKFFKNKFNFSKNKRKFSSNKKIGRQRKRRPLRENPPYKNNEFPVLRETPINRALQRIPQTSQKKEKQELDRRAKRFIKLSKEGNLDPKSFSRKEKARAIQMARSNPEKNFIRRSIYYKALMEVLNNEDQKPPKKKPIKKGDHYGKNKKARTNNPTMDKKPTR